MIKYSICVFLRIIPSLKIRARTDPRDPQFTTIVVSCSGYSGLTKRMGSLSIDLVLIEVFVQCHPDSTIESLRLTLFPVCGGIVRRVRLTQQHHLLAMPWALHSPAMVLHIQRRRLFSRVCHILYAIRRGRSLSHEEVSARPFIDYISLLSRCYPSKHFISSCSKNAVP